MYDTIRRIESLGTRHVVKHLDRNVMWRRFGDGPPLVLVHGGHGNWLHWVRNIEALSRRHTLWLPDMPGFGESDSLVGAPHAKDRMSRLVNALHATLDTLVGAATAFDIVGFSFGGLVAAQLASRVSLRRLALLGPVGHGGTRRLNTELLDWRVPDPSARLAALRQNLSALMLHDPATVDPMAMTVYEVQCLATRFRSKSISRAGELQTALGRFEGPLLLVWGEHDPTAVPQEMAPRLAAGRISCTCHIVGGAGHWVQYERDAEITALLASWFAPD